ncbi:glycerol-3-phosphate dehydrogenase/oxidase [Rouxiella sp. T17]|uniref:glycerol-3-phosphate dehydrogenase/oxidase n=1 Tax=Rouxiella sp. T17 TaxID=3085684 RepID=UPI002FC90A40
MVNQSQQVDTQREQKIARIQGLTETPVVIIGGGINGISTFRELALQGVPVIMVEQGDWCQAASGALSRMIHGGLRYLETGEFSLVKESVEERDRLLKNAPHYVAPLRTTVPIDSWSGGLVNAGKRFFRLTERPSRRGALIIKTGLSMYDLYTRQYGSMPRHQLNGEQATRQSWPDFAEWVKCSATYYDGWISAPERLGVELVNDAEQANPLALALNYTQLIASDGETLTFKDTLGNQTFTLRPHVVVNATGAWIDRANSTLRQNPATRKLIGGTKGSHLIIRHPKLLAALNGGMVYYENEEGRVCIMFPWYGNVLVGSTDIRIDNPDDVVCTDEEQRYILQSLKFVFPTIDIKEEDVLYTFSGVRPLPFTDSEINGRISRNHTLVLLPPDATRYYSTLCLVGGKWTTFRKFGEQAAHKVLKLLGRTRKISTEEMAIGGGKDYPQPERKAAWIQQISKQNNLPIERISQLLTRYGTLAAQIAVYITQQPDQPLSSYAEYSRNELRYLIHHEQVQTLEDLLVRRTPMAISGNLTMQRIEEIAQLLGEALHWDDDQRAQQLETTLSRLAKLHGLTSINAPSPSNSSPSASPHSTLAISEGVSHDSAS